MSTGLLLLSVMTLVLAGDMAMGMYFRVLADRAESGGAVPSNVDPANTRKIATLMLVSAPLIWLLIALISFGVIPSGIDPIKF